MLVEIRVMSLNQRIRPEPGKDPVFYHVAQAFIEVLSILARPGGIYNSVILLGQSPTRILPTS